MNRFLTIPSNSNIYRKKKNILALKIQNNHYIDQFNNNKFYKETISSINKKYNAKELSPRIIIKKKTEEEYNDIEIKKQQENFLNSLLSKNKSHKIIEFEQYNSVLSRSLDNYKSKGIEGDDLYSRKYKNYQRINDMENINLTEKNIRKNASLKNKLKININNINYKNPFQSLNIINDNNSVFNEISKDVLVRQRNLYEKTVESREGNLRKFNIKMPKIKVSNLNPKIGDEIAMINLVGNKEENKN